MAKFNGMTLTNQGSILLADALTGGNITFTKISIGDGYVQEGVNVKELTDLVSLKQNLVITSMTPLLDGVAKLRATLNNSELIEDMYIREIGAYAKGDDDIEILYSYSTAGDDADLIPAGGGVNVVEEILDVLTIIGDATEVTAVIDETLVYVTVKDLNDGLNTKEDKFTKNSGFNKNKSDAIDLDDPETLSTSKAVKLLNDFLKSYCDTSIADLVNSSPAALDTLNELAAALGDDPNFATTVTNSIALKLAHGGYGGTAQDIVDLLSDLSNKENITRHNSTTDIPTMQDNASNHLDERQDSNTGKIYICINESGSAAVPNPTADFEEISVWQNAKKVENLLKFQYQGGSEITTGLIIKTGEVFAVEDTTTSVTFDDPFPNACWFANVNISQDVSDNPGTDGGNPYIRTKDTTGLVIQNPAEYSTGMTVNWVAIGY